MKKIMWLCNTPLPEIRLEFGVKICGEGWLQGISDQLREQKDIELHYVFPQSKNTKLYHTTINNISFWGFYSNGGKGYEFSGDRQQTINSIIRKIQPDIIHIFGTEFAHSLECMRTVRDKRDVIVSTQGLISELAKVYMEGIPLINCIFGRSDSGGWNSLLSQKYQFYRRGKNEKEILKKAVNVIGRTDWDKKCIKAINPGCQYFYCSETMREPFYEGRWNIDRVERYSIYISQANYPIKGLHIFIKAFRKVLQQYPQAVAYVAGKRKFLQSGDGYGRYIQKLLKKYEMTEKIIFLGILSAEQVKARMLKVHVMVMPSLLENSPNSIGEAILLGTPVVAADVGGIPSLIQHGKEGILYSGHKVSSLARGIEYIFENDDAVRRISFRARKRARQLYDREQNLNQLISIYEKVTDQKNFHFSKEKKGNE